MSKDPTKLQNNIQNTIDKMQPNANSADIAGNAALFGTALASAVKFLTRSGTSSATMPKPHGNLRGAVVDDTEYMLSPEIRKILEDRPSKEEKVKNMDEFIKVGEDSSASSSVPYQLPITKEQHKKEKKIKKLTNRASGKFTQRLDKMKKRAQKEGRIGL